MPDDQPPPKIMTKEMIEKFKAQLDEMHGVEIKEGGPITHQEIGGHSEAWYIAYSTQT